MACSGLGPVRRDDHGHVRDHPHHRDVLDGLVRSAVLAHRDARVARHDLHVQVRIADGLPHLLPGPARGEHRKGARERQLAADGESRGRAHHVLLGNADIEEPVREHLGELRGLGRTRQVRVQHHHVVPFFPEVDQRIPVCISCRYLCHVILLYDRNCGLRDRGYSD